MSGSTRRLDEMLRDWPAPSRPDEAWEAQVAAIEAKVARAGGEIEGALLEPPPFAAEDEAGPTKNEPMMRETKKRGDASMSDVPEKPKGPEKRVSLAEMAQQLKARTSQPPVSERDEAGRTSAPPGSRVSVPPSARTSMPPAARTSVPPSAPRASDPGRTSGTGDSGIVDLKAVAAASDPNAPQIPPASTSLFDEDHAKAAAAQAPAKKPAAKSSSGALVGIGLAAVGIAAAIAVVVMNGNKGQEPPAVAAVAEAPKPAAPPTTTQAPAAPTAAAAPTASVAAASPDDLPSADQPKAVAAAGAAVGPAVPAPAKAEPNAKPAEPTATAPAATAVAAAPPPAGTNAGDLKNAMQKAAGATEAKTDQPAPTPASGPDPGSIPEQPSQGAIQSAIGAHMGAAKACVKDLEAVSHVNLTFGSDGKVKSISVTGAAASNGADGCIKAAFAKAGVGPFSRSSYSVGFTVRP